MPRYLLLFALLVCQLRLSAQNPTSFPRYTEVLDHLRAEFRLFSPVSRGPNGLLLYKTPEGYLGEWYIYDYDEETWEAQLEPFEIWKPKGGFVDDLEFGKGDQLISFGEDLLSPNYHNFKVELVPLYDLHRYAGYADASDDVLAYYEDHPPKTAADHYSLAMVLSEAYNDYFSEENALLQVDPDRKATLFDLVKRSLDHYRQAAKLDADYATERGSAATVYADEWMDRYVMLDIMGWKADGEALLKKDELYASSSHLLGRNLLENCEQDAILFVQDRHTFHLLSYLQTFKKVRTDVLLVMPPYITYPPYVEYLKSDRHAGGAVPLDVEPAAHALGNNYELSSKGFETWSMREVVDWLNEQEDEEASRWVPAKHFVLEVEGQPEISLKNWNYEYKTHWLMLAILSANQNKRPVYYTIPFKYDNNDYGSIGQRQHLATKGLLARFQFEDVPEYQPKSVISKNYPAVLKLLEGPPIKDIAVLDRRLIVGYSDALFDLIYDLERAGMEEETRAIMKGFYRHFGPCMEDLMATISHINVRVGQFAKVGLTKEAKGLLDDHLDYLLRVSEPFEEFSDAYERHGEWFPEEQAGRLQEWNKQLRELLYVSRKYDLSISNKKLKIIEKRLRHFPEELKEEED